MSDGPASTPGDPFAPQKANIRDTVKWMVAAYSGVAAVLIAGTSLSGLGALPAWRLALAAISGFFVLLFIFLALSATLKILIGDNFFAGDPDQETKALIDEHPEDVLPPGFSTYDAFLAERRAARAAVASARQERYPPLPVVTPTPTAEDIAKLDATLTAARARFRDVEAVTRRLVGQAHLISLQYKLNRLRIELAILTAFGIVALVVCIWTLTPPKPEAKPLSIVIPGASLSAPLKK